MHDRIGWKLVKAAEVPEGTCFVKRTGFFAYLRISESSEKYFGLKPGYVYGVCYNGNMTSVIADKMVWSVPLLVMDCNRQAERDWEKSVGCIESSDYLANTTDAAERVC